MSHGGSHNTSRTPSALLLDRTGMASLMAVGDAFIRWLRTQERVRTLLTTLMATLMTMLVTTLEVTTLVTTLLTSPHDYFQASIRFDGETIPTFDGEMGIQVRSHRSSCPAVVAFDVYLSMH